MNTDDFGIEIDFLPVGDGSRSADAIGIRYGDLTSGDPLKQWVVIIDGGTKQSGQALVELVKTHYKTGYADLVVMTHPDRDHASGLTEVLNGLNVGELWMHRPWLHSTDIRQHFIDGRITDSSLERRLRVSMDAAHEVEQIALEKGINIIEPFEGTVSTDGVVTILGPSKSYYQSLLPEFSKTPESESTINKAVGLFNRAVAWITESFAEEHLPGGDTSAENDSSAILLLRVAGRKHLIVGDAGVPALRAANTYAATQGIRLDNLSFMQVPHHGSKKNVNTEILDAIKASIAFISAAKEGAPKHPSQRVINALVKRNTNVCVTKGTHVYYHHNIPWRAGWSPIPSLEFQATYQE